MPTTPPVKVVSSRLTTLSKRSGGHGITRFRFYRPAYANCYFQVTNGSTASIIFVLVTSTKIHNRHQHHNFIHYRSKTKKLERYSLTIKHCRKNTHLTFPPCLTHKLPHSPDISSRSHLRSHAEYEISFPNKCPLPRTSASREHP